MSRLTAIICAVVICLLVSMSWAIKHYRGNAITYKDQRERATEQLSLANATIKDMQIRQRDVAALDAKYTKELSDAKSQLDRYAFHCFYQPLVFSPSFCSKAD